MSRALGAAFLNHQVEQLEKTVSNGPASGNWRSRRQLGPPHNNNAQVAPNSKQPKRTTPSPSGIMEVSRRDREFPALSGRPQGRERTGVRSYHSQDSPAHINGRRRPSEEKERHKEKEKDADVVVVDASVLVHALYQVKKWCRDGREEVIIIPLEGRPTTLILFVSLISAILSSVKYPRSAQERYYPACATGSCSLTHSRGAGWHKPPHPSPARRCVRPLGSN
jgi:hypothetical protein